VTKPVRASRFRLRSLLSYLALPGALLAQSERLPLVAVAALAVGLAPLAGFLRLKALTLDWQWPTGQPWYVGDSVYLRTAATNNGKRTTPMVTIVAQSPGLPLPAVTVPMLRPGETTQVTARFPLAVRRGPAPMSRTTRAHNLLQGSGRAVNAASLGALLPAVRPRPVLPPADLLERLSRPTEDGFGTGRKGGSDPLSLRRFVSGDPVSAVHWRSTARAGVPIVMEREQLASGMLVLLVTTGGEGQLWETAIARAAGLVQAASTLAVPVAVVAAAPAEQLTGAPTHDLVQDWLAGLGVAGPGNPAQVAQAVRLAAGGVVAVLSAEPRIAASVREAGADPRCVVDLVNARW
jgi:uncharacterized protein (DUF58 family)